MQNDELPRHRTSTMARARGGEGFLEPKLPRARPPENLAAPPDNLAPVVGQFRGRDPGRLRAYMYYVVN